ncbi:MAG TPA: hypothetical protein VHY08_19465 [Bacillota bacterium]|nr:hypothetical protein [Bacillota bacterium]
MGMMIACKEEARYYIIINWVIVGLCLYALLLPFISPFLTPLAPEIFQCSYLRITHQLCVFCGVTRDFEAIMVGTYTVKSALNSRSLALFVLILGELIFRAMIILRLGRIKKVKGLIWIDTGIHALLAIYPLLLIYKDLRVLVDKM